MAETVRSADIFYKGKKVALATGGTLELPSNATDQITAAGWIGTSVGPKTSKLTLNAILPVAGLGLTVLVDMLQDKTVDIGVGVLDGKIFEIEMVCMNTRYEWDNTQGTQTISADFSGGEPALSG